VRLADRGGLNRFVASGGISMKTRPTWLLLAAGTAAVWLAACQTTEPLAYDGQNLYLGYCAACHGASGAGDGPAASQLNVAVPDLRILTGADGVFPRDRIAEVVDGRSLRAAHGSWDMPVWGYSFRRDEGDTAEGRRNVQARIDALVDHIEGLQAKP
jgi:mono/diheme cytochrome c family protein